MAKKLTCNVLSVFCAIVRASTLPSLFKTPNICMPKTWRFCSGSSVGRGDKADDFHRRTRGRSWSVAMPDASVSKNLRGLKKMDRRRFAFVLNLTFSRKKRLLLLDAIRFYVTFVIFAETPMEVLVTFQISPRQCLSMIYIYNEMDVSSSHLANSFSS